MSLSLKSFVQGSKFLSGLLKPVSKAYAGAAGYRQIGNFTILNTIEKRAVH
jgi:ubiquinol-cytochrome c reductase subunit 7